MSQLRRRFGSRQPMVVAREAKEASDLMELLRLGEVLIEHGVLSQEQVQRVLERQRMTGQPFGALCEGMFHVDPEAIENAWAMQYAALTRTLDPRHEAFDSAALELVSRRQAWQFRVLPIRFEDRELMMATTRRHLRRALRFANNVLGVPVYLVLAEPMLLGEALQRHYPMPGMSPRAIDDDALDQVLAERRMSA